MGRPRRCTLAIASRRDLGFGPASVFRAFMRTAGLKNSLNRNRCVSSTFRTAGPALPRTQRGGCRRTGQGQPAGSELPHLMSGGVAPGMRNQWQGTCRSSQAGSVFGRQVQHRSPAPKRPPDNIPPHHRQCPAQYIFPAVPDEPAWRRRRPTAGRF